MSLMVNDSNANGLHCTVFYANAHFTATVRKREGSDSPSIMGYYGVPHATRMQARLSAAAMLLDQLSSEPTRSFDSVDKGK